MSEVAANLPNMNEAILRKWVSVAIMPTKITDVYEAEANVFYLRLSHQLESRQVGMIRACGFDVEESPRFAIGSYRLEWIIPVDDEY